MSKINTVHDFHRSPRNRGVADPILSQLSDWINIFVAEMKQWASRKITRLRLSRLKLLENSLGTPPGYQSGV
jgi:hypothetical protein